MSNSNFCDFQTFSTYLINSADFLGCVVWPWCEVVHSSSPFQTLSILLDSMFLDLKIKPEKKNWHTSALFNIWFWKADFPDTQWQIVPKGVLESRIHDTILGLSKFWVAKTMSKSQACPVEFGRCFLCFRITRPRTNGKTPQKWWNLGRLQFPAADFWCPAVRCRWCT